jgi:hypothetical protein
VRGDNATQALVRSAVETYMKRSDLGDFSVTVAGHDDYEAPCLLIMEVAGEPVAMDGVVFPLRIAEQLSDSGVQAGVGLELVNWFLFDQLTDPEKDMAQAIMDARKQVPDPAARTAAVEQIRLRYEVAQETWILELARKLKGDVEVLGWMSDAGFDQHGMVEFLELLHKESQDRILQSARYVCRMQSLQARTSHAEFIIQGLTEEAEQMRLHYGQVAQRVLLFTTETPPTK